MLKKKNSALFHKKETIYLFYCYIVLYYFVCFISFVNNSSLISFLFIFCYFIIDVCRVFLVVIIDMTREYTYK